MGKRNSYEIRFKESSKGRDGGLGKVKAFRTSASSPQKAIKKMRKKGRILSIRSI